MSRSPYDPTHRLSTRPDSGAGEPVAGTSQGASAAIAPAGPSGRRRLQKRHALAEKIFGGIGQAFLFLVASSSAIAVIFIILFIFRYAMPFFGDWSRVGEFFTSTSWRPTAEEHSFGALAIFVGTAMVTVGAIIVAVPLGVLAAVCLSDVIPFRLRQYVKPVIEILAAIPSVAYGFFALVIFAPLLQQQGGMLLAIAMWIIGLPLAGLATLVVSDLVAARFAGKDPQIAGPEGEKRAGLIRLLTAGVMGSGLLLLLWAGHGRLSAIEIASGANALNVSLILGIMALPTIVSVSEDALYAVGRDLREGSYALGATRAETVIRVVLPAARSGIFAAIILGVMRAIGETMVVWMASGNAIQIPDGLNYLEPVRTMTATIAAEMGEADHSAGAEHYSALFALALMLLVISLVCNLISEGFIRRSRRLGR